jgi:hypothetical protein
MTLTTEGRKTLNCLPVKFESGRNFVQTSLECCKICKLPHLEETLGKKKPVNVVASNENELHLADRWILAD